MEKASACGPLNLSTHTPRSSDSTLTSPPCCVMELRSLPRYSSIVSTVISGKSSPTFTTSSTAGPNFFLSNFSIPPFIVADDDAHVPHAPLRRTAMIPFSIFTNSTFPPSAMRYGRTSSSASSTFSGVSSSKGSSALLPSELSAAVSAFSAAAASAANGLTTATFSSPSSTTVFTADAFPAASRASSASHSAFSAGVSPFPNASRHRLASAAKTSRVVIALFLNAITRAVAARARPARARVDRNACATFFA